jgi:uncharacterized protein YndB with AHSA1/START domain
VKQNPQDRGAAVFHIFRFDGNHVVEMWDLGQPVPENMPNENGMFLSEVTMQNLKLTKEPVARVEMLIRKPVAEVFEAFIDPEITSQFWFTKSSGRIEAGKQVTWYWEMYNISVPVSVREVEANKRILIDWGNYDSATTVEWIFTPYGRDATYVSITNSGFSGDGDKAVRDALDSTGGFTWVLAGLKAFLEHNIKLNLIADAFPKRLRDR